MTQNEVLQLYTAKFLKLKQGNNTCSISRMQVTSMHGYQLIDACPIRPLSIYNDDTVLNVFALCPTLRRAFDRGMIGVNENYRVVVSRYIKEEDTAFSLNKLAGVELYLPMPEAYYPLVGIFVAFGGTVCEVKENIFT